VEITPFFVEPAQSVEGVASMLKTPRKGSFVLAATQPSASCVSTGGDGPLLNIRAGHVEC
jgi:hypothetical protein